MFSAALSGAAVFVEILDKNRKLCYTYDSLNRVIKRNVKNLSNAVTLNRFAYANGNTLMRIFSGNNLML